MNDDKIFPLEKNSQRLTCLDHRLCAEHDLKFKFNLRTNLREFVFVCTNGAWLVETGNVDICLNASWFWAEMSDAVLWNRSSTVDLEHRLSLGVIVLNWNRVREFLENVSSDICNMPYRNSSDLGRIKFDQHIRYSSARRALWNSEWQRTRR